MGVLATADKTVDAICFLRGEGDGVVFLGVKKFGRGVCSSVWDKKIRYGGAMSDLRFLVL